MDYFKSGCWNVICEVCGRQYKSDEVRKRWDGVIVCFKDFENRQPLDMIRPYPPERPVPFVRDEAEDEFIYVCYIEASQGIADLGEADCARADYVLPLSVRSHL